MAEKVFFIVNKYSGKGFQEKVEGQIIDACMTAGVEGTIEYTQHKGHATALAREAAAAGFSRIFARGGDGTVNEAARGLVHSSAALGILPAGSGNGLARHLGVPLSLPAALRQLSHFRMLTMDTLRINDGLSVNVSGFGFDGYVASLFGKDGKRGLLGYSKLVLREFLRYKTFEISAEIDGKISHHKAFMVAVANASQFGNNAVVAPDASVSDGIVDVCFIKKVPLIEAIPFLTKLFQGRIRKSRFVTLVKAKNFKAQLSSPQPYHLDGEPAKPTARFDVAVQPDSLRVIVPEPQRQKRSARR